MQDLSKPRRKKYDLSDIKNEKQRALAEIIRDVMNKYNLTSQQYADIEPSVGITTVNKTAYSNKEYVPTPRTVKIYAQKNARITGRAVEEVYKELMEACGYSVADYPFSTEKKTEKTKKANILLDLVEKASNLETKFSGEIRRDYSVYGLYNKINDDYYAQNALFAGSYSLVLDYTAAEQSNIDYWAIDTITNNSENGFLIKEFLTKILMDGNAKYPNERVKYSLVVTEQSIFALLKDVDLVNLNLIVSIILYDEEKGFSEIYLRTGKNPTRQEIMGLSFGNWL